MRVLYDLRQHRAKAHVPASRVCISRSGMEKLPIGRLPTNEIVFIGPDEAQTRAGWAKRVAYEAEERCFLERRHVVPPSRSSPPVHPPRRIYRPQDMGPLHPQFEIYDRVTGVVLARVRGTREFIHNEAHKLAGAYNSAFDDLLIKQKITIAISA